MTRLYKAASSMSPPVGLDFEQACAGPQYARRDIQVALAPSVSAQLMISPLRYEMPRPSYAHCRPHGWSRGLRAFASLSLARSGGRGRLPVLKLPEDDKSAFGLCLAYAPSRRQSGVRVSPAGHVRRGVDPPKIITTSTRPLPPGSLFHHPGPGWWQPP